LLILIYKRIINEIYKTKQAFCLECTHVPDDACTPAPAPQSRLHPRNVPPRASRLDARPTVRHPPWRPHRSTCATTYPSPRPASAVCPHPSPSPAPRPPQRASAPTTTTCRHIHMADDAVAGGAAVRCAGPAPASLSSSRKQQQQPDDAGCGSSDDHYQHDVIMLRRTRSGRAFPPPISVIGKGGRPWLCLRAHREGGRLVLRQMRLPSQELLQPCKEDGRFKLLMHPEARARPCGGGTPQERQGNDS
jgi:hypothetical protein